MASQISGSLGGAEKEGKEESSTAENSGGPASTPEATVVPEVTPTPVVEPSTPEGNAEIVDDGDNEDEPLTRRKARGLRSEARNLRQAKKELADENNSLKEKLQELETKLSEYAEKVTNHERATVVSSVQKKFGLSEKQMKYVTGDTAEEMERSAKEFLEALGSEAVDYSSLRTGAGSGPASSSVLNMSEEEIRKNFGN